MNEDEKEVFQLFQDDEKLNNIMDA